MSAYLCSKAHIVYLVHSATAFMPDIYWYHKGGQKFNRWGDLKPLVDIGNTLVAENQCSVNNRYRTSDTGYILTENDFRDSRPKTFDPVQVLKSCICYAYQSCEHSEWKESEAKSFIEAVKLQAINALPGYNACKWGCPTD